MLTGTSVTLRPLRGEDLDAAYAIASELETWEERTGRAPNALSREAYAERFTKVLTELSDDATFVIEAEGEFVGKCDLFGVDNLARNAEVGIELAAAARGRGYGTDAMRVLVRYAFERRNFYRVHLSVLASNAAAIASYRKAGFVEEGRTRQSAWVRGEYQDQVLMGQLATEWEQRQVWSR